MSHKIAQDKIAKLGAWHYGRKQIQPCGRIIEKFQEDAASILRYSLLKFEQNEFVHVADAFANIIAQECYTCYACAVMPDHVPILIRKHKHSAEEMLDNLQESSRYISLHFKNTAVGSSGLGRQRLEGVSLSSTGSLPHYSIYRGQSHTMGTSSTTLAICD
jgi:REP element-mobilizing transposase RayT